MKIFLSSKILLEMKFHENFFFSFILQRRYTRVNSQGGSLYGGGPEYDDPANCAPEEDQYGSQYGGKVASLSETIRSLLKNF